MPSTHAAIEPDMDADLALRSPASRLDRISTEDFETASIRSAAPSYVSEAPSYHSTIPGAERIPAYSGPATSGTTTPSSANNATVAASTASEAPATPAAAFPPTNNDPAPASQPAAGPTGLPPIPPLRRRGDVSSLAGFRIPTWSNVSSNPTARHYHSVANRRVAAASSSSSSSSSRRAQQQRYLTGDVAPPRRIGGADDDDDAPQGKGKGPDEDGRRERVRPEEDPYLVGEDAARRARADRLAAAARWRPGDEVLVLEDKRWDWFLAQMNDSDERERSWKRFHDDVSTGRATKLARRINSGRFF